MRKTTALKDISHVTVFLKSGPNVEFRQLERLEICSESNINEVMNRIVDESYPLPAYRPPYPGEIKVTYILELKANKYKVIKEKKMNNKQLALLLRSIARNIDALADQIEPFIEQGLRQDVRVWAGEGPEPGGLDTRQFLSKNYEFRPEGEYVVIGMVREFAEQLREEANMLTEEVDDQS